MGKLSERSAYAINPILEEDELATQLHKRGKKVIKLNRGDPPVYFPTPKYIIDAYVKALRGGKTYYSDATGIDELKEAVQGRYSRMYGLHIDSDGIIATAGISEALHFLNDVMVNPGERAIIFKPYYTAYIPRLKLAGGEPIFENYDEKDGWNIEIEHVRASIKRMRANKEMDKVKYMLITNPNNPTGTVLKRSILKDIAEIANDNDLLLVSDEIYDEIVFNGAQFTSISKVAKGQPYMILNGASKDFDATGFRLGLMLLPENDRLSMELRERLRNFAKVRLSVNTPAEYAFAEGMSNVKEHSKAIKSMVREIEARVNYAYDILKKNDYIEAVKPNGAFYILPRLRMDMLKIKDDRDFVVKLLKKEYIQLTRGSGFGAPNHFRIVLLPPKGILEYSLNKINDFCESISK